jgi:hypothetical protein
MRVELGDTFLIRADADRVAVGQVVSMEPSSRQVWVAIFWPPIEESEIGARLPELISTPPALLGRTLDAFLKDGHWQRLGRADVVAPIAWPAFKIASAPGVFQVVDHDGVPRRWATDEEVATLRFRSTMSPAGIEMAVAALAGAAEWHEAFDKLRPGTNTESEILGPTL